MVFNGVAIALTIVMATIHVMNVAFFIISHARGDGKYSQDYWLIVFPSLIALNLTYLIYEA